jgi:DNA-binding NarL/FixJ family response regulator
MQYNGQGNCEESTIQFKKIYVWGPNHFTNRLLADQIKKNVGAAVKCLTENEEIDSLMLDNNSIVFCDCDKMEAKYFCSSLSRSNGLNCGGPSIVLLNVDPSKKLVEEINRYSIRGIFYTSDNYDNINKGLRLVFFGEYWLPRELLVESLRLARDQSRGNQVAETNLLTNREAQILNLIVSGYSNQNIADKLFISSNTVKTHVSNLYKKINVTNRVQAILWSAENLNTDPNTTPDMIEEEMMAADYHR